MALRAMFAGLALTIAGLIPDQGQAQVTCDFSGFAKPCVVEGGAYRALVPEGDGPFPMMVYLYGSGGDSGRIAEHPVFQASIVERGYALVVPVARNMQYRPGQIATGWNLRHEPSGTRNDALFVERVIKDAARHFYLDAEQVLLAGQSRGGFLIWEMACHEPWIASAYAVHGAGYLGKMPETCQQPVRLMHSHGQEDAVVPLQGKEFISGGVSMMPVDESMEVMSRTNGCVSEPVTASPIGPLARTTWEGCRTGSSLDLLLHQGGHSMPAEWFRAIVDWFEETPAVQPEAKPRIVGLGTRTEGQFKSIPRSGSLLGGARVGEDAPQDPAQDTADSEDAEDGTGGIKRLRPPKQDTE